MNDTPRRPKTFFPTTDEHGSAMRKQQQTLIPEHDGESELGVPSGGSGV